VVAIAATESLDRMMEKRAGPSEHRRRIGETVHWAREIGVSKSDAMGIRLQWRMPHQGVRVLLVEDDPDRREHDCSRLAEVGSFGGSSILNRDKRQKRSLRMTNRL
jgi:hypothetical protein